MAKGDYGLNIRECKVCSKPVIDVRDAFTGGTYPVGAEGFTVVVLEPGGPGERNARAQIVTGYRPHLPSCENGETTP